MQDNEQKRLPHPVAQRIARRCHNDGFQCTSGDVQQIAMFGTHYDESLASRVLQYIEQAKEQGEM